jgi:hypothetical protein
VCVGGIVFESTAHAQLEFAEDIGLILESSGQAPPDDKSRRANQEQLQQQTEGGSRPQNFRISPTKEAETVNGSWKCSDDGGHGGEESTTEHVLPESSNQQKSLTTTPTDLLEMVVEIDSMTCSPLFDIIPA